MPLFDPAIFDPAIFDTGAAVVADTPYDVGHWAYVKRKRKKRKEPEDERRERIEALERAFDDKPLGEPIELPAEIKEALPELPIEIRSLLDQPSISEGEEDEIITALIMAGVI